MKPLLLTHAAATWALVGLIWLVQLVQYPLFAHVGMDVFPAYHARHTRHITGVVAPLMLIELASAALLVGRRMRVARAAVMRPDPTAVDVRFMRRALELARYLSGHPFAAVVADPERVVVLAEGANRRRDGAP